MIDKVILVNLIRKAQFWRVNGDRVKDNRIDDRVYVVVARHTPTEKLAEDIEDSPVR